MFHKINKNEVVKIKCKKCGINKVENEGDICFLCKFREERKKEGKVIVLA